MSFKNTTLSVTGAFAVFLASCIPSSAIPITSTNMTYIPSPTSIVQNHVENVGELARLVSDVVEQAVEDKIRRDETEKLNELLNHDKATSSKSSPPNKKSGNNISGTEAGGMKPIDVGKIKIEPFEFVTVLEVRIDKELNEHTTLYVRGVIKHEKEIAPVLNSTQKTNVIFSNDGAVYFRGLLKNINITCRNAVYNLEVYAVSNTVLLDTVKHKRSFQYKAQTYEDIVKEIISGESGSIKKYNAPVQKLDQEKQKILLQYDETDWEFAKRLASHTQSALITISSSTVPEFYFGVSENGKGEVALKNYSITKDLDLYRRMMQEDTSFSDSDAILYNVETDDFLDYELGEKLRLNGKNMYVLRASLRLVDASLSCFYTLATKNAISAPKIYNSAIIGLSLPGKVLKSENDDVKLHLTIDKDMNRGGDEGKSHFFTYATGYSAEKHTGWYVMPEVDDTVQLYFPTKEEHDAYAAASVRQSDTEKTSDPLVKYLRTPFGKEIKLDEKEILITSKDNETFIQINEDSGIVIKSPKPISISSGSTMDIFSDDDMTITTKKNLTITADSSVSIFNGKNDFKMNPKTGISSSTDKEFKVESTDNMTLDSKKDVSVKSTKDTKITADKDMTLSSSKKLAGSAQTALELSCSGSSVKMDGNVDIKGKLIKEN